MSNRVSKQRVHYSPELPGPPNLRSFFPAPKPVNTTADWLGYPDRKRTTSPNPILNREGAKSWKKTSRVWLYLLVSDQALESTQKSPLQLVCQRYESRSQATQQCHKERTSKSSVSYIVVCIHRLIFEHLSSHFFPIY